MILADIIAQITGVESYGAVSVELSSIVYDSRKAVNGSLFVAVSGVKTDGNDYVASAISRGAVAVITENKISDCPVAQVVVKDSRLALAQAARAFYGSPSRKLKLLAVTGTNGKTTTAYLMRHMILSCGNTTGMLGTVEYDIGNGEVIPSPLTTPQSADFQQYLSEMVLNDADYAVAEMSSHAIVQRRVLPDDVTCAVFTNLTRDHLDYHGSMENYLAAKKILFSGLSPESVAVVNSGDVYARLIVDDTDANVVTFGFERDDDYRICGVDYYSKGTMIELEYSGEVYQINSPLVGEYNVLNVVGAIAGVVEGGLDLAETVASIAGFCGVPGRLERMELSSGAGAFVDYAHTPDALEKALKALRPVTDGRLMVVFGCGGDRDSGKRPQMGNIACELADCVYITSDNPRSEKAENIIEDILGGCVSLKGSDSIIVEVDRQKAIEKSLAAARRGDIVLVAGKGHEDYQIIGTKKIHFDDREIVRKFCSQKAG